MPTLYMELTEPSIEDDQSHHIPSRLPFLQAPPIHEGGVVLASASGINSLWLLHVAAFLC